MNSKKARALTRKVAKDLVKIFKLTAPTVKVEQSKEEPTFFSFASKGSPLVWYVRLYNFSFTDYETIEITIEIQIVDGRTGIRFSDPIVIEEEADDLRDYSDTLGLIQPILNMLEPIFVEHIHK